MEYVNAYLVVCARTMTSVSNMYQEVEMTANIYCPHGAFLDKSEAIEYANNRRETTIIIPCKIPEVRRVCKVEWKTIGDDVAAAYCDCGQELDRCRDYEPAHIPNHCPKCGAELVM